MKKTILTFIGTILAVIVFSQVPSGIKYQAVIRNSAGQVIANQTVKLRISILQGGVTGTNVYSETHTVQTNSFGLVNVDIGSGTVVSGTYNSINWGNSSSYFKLELDPSNTGTFTEMGTSQFLSVPYALYAKNAGSISNESQTLTLNSNQLSISGTGGNTVTFNNWDTDNTNDVTTSGNQTITGNKTFSGTITVPNPTNNTDAATKAYVDELKLRIELLESKKLQDVDGNIYNAVKVGRYIWMAENLRTTKYNDGTPIAQVTDNAAWGALTTGAYCWYNNDGNTYKNTYGALYNWYIVTNDNLCPYGWHIPSDSEWTTLTNLLGGETIAGGKMKEIGTVHWNSPNTGATNESGFTALPSGRRNYDGTFDYFGNWANFWSTTEVSVDFAWRRSISTNSANIYRNSDWYKKNGFSIRCIQDYNL